ncbi:MAG: divalent metal cation transporter, partial [Bacteroidota bacterium]
MNLKKYFGPSTLVAAAFIGPGTLTTCTIVGVQTSYSLLWAMLFAIAATIVLQEMAARLGFVTQEGLGEAFRKQFTQPLSRYLVFFLVIGAILVGNAAYEAGNISGGILGLDLLVGEYQLWPVIIGIVCFTLMYFGGYQWV